MQSLVLKFIFILLLVSVTASRFKIRERLSSDKTTSPPSFRVLRFRRIPTNRDPRVVCYAHGFCLPLHAKPNNI